MPYENEHVCYWSVSVKLATIHGLPEREMSSTDVGARMRTYIRSTVWFLKIVYSICLPTPPQLSLNSVCIEIVGLIYATEENLRFLDPIMRFLLLIVVFSIKLETIVQVHVIDISVMMRFICVVQRDWAFVLVWLESENQVSGIVDYRYGRHFDELNRVVGSVFSYMVCTRHHPCHSDMSWKCVRNHRKSSKIWNFRRPVSCSKSRLSLEISGNDEHRRIRLFDEFNHMVGSHFPFVVDAVPGGVGNPGKSSEMRWLFHMIFTSSGRQFSQQSPGDLATGIKHNRVQNAIQITISEHIRINDQIWQKLTITMVMARGK